LAERGTDGLEDRCEHVLRVGALHEAHVQVEPGGERDQPRAPFAGGTAREIKVSGHGAANGPWADVLHDPSDRVALLLPNIPDFPRAYYAALALGAVVVPIHALLRAEEAAYVLSDSGAKVLICAGRYPLTGRERRLVEATTDEAEAKRILKRFLATRDQLSPCAHRKRWT